MAIKAYAAHEQATAGALMLVKMILGAAVCGLLLGTTMVFLGLARIDARFVSRGFPPGAVRSFIVNHFLWNGLPLPLSMETPPAFAGFMPPEGLSRRDYNRLLVKKFASVHSAHLLEKALRDTRRLGLSALILGVMAAVLYYLFFTCRSRKIQHESHLKGARLLSPGRFLSRIENLWPDPLSIRLGEICFPRNREPFHTLVYGASGSGKSTLMNQLLSAVRTRQERHQTKGKAIVYDVKGEYLAKHYRPDRGDLVFFPFDARSLRWRLFNEVLGPDGRLDMAMLDVVSAVLCSPPGSRDPKNEYFHTAAGEVLRAMLLVLHARGSIQNADLAVLLGQSRGRLASLFQEYLPESEQSALEHISAPEQAAGVLGVLKNQLRFMRYLDGLDGAFCLRDFIESDDERTLFLMNLPRLAEIFRPLLTFAVDLMIRHSLSLGDSPDRRIRFFIDELGSLGRIDSLFRFLTLSRSKGGCLIASSQEEGSIREIYGGKRTESFHNNFGSLLVFRQNDEKSAGSMSRQLGEHEVIQRQESRSFSPSSMGDRLSVGDQRKRETLVTYSQLQHLPDLECYYRLTGVGAARFRVPPVFLPERHPHHIPREEFS